ncbi:WD40/YVTN/BNR-like repeat-containing protein [Candidatus Cryosericum hinesii]|uniref:WD40/YVTN/BNR-like repeat-containing protein n=1 Tax=Candidatus Cryosericum hinesii TaxID=2290915 RepID=UPI00140229BE|nr:hypothetical protein [Candidatus Cryosericum hinesii]
MMKHVGRVVAAVLLVFVVAVVWYAHSGEAVVMRHVFTNAASIAEGTIWVRSDKGLFGGPVTAIASFSSNGAVVYAGTREDEIYVSSDGGSDWTPLGGASSGHYVAGIEVDPRANGRIVGKAVYGAGFFLSEDGGQTWKNASRGLGSRSLSCLASPAGSPDTLFAGTGDAGLFISRDGGRSWSRTGRKDLGDRIAAVDASRDGRTVYAGTQETGLFVSRDGGGMWNAIVLPFGSQPMVTGIDIDPADELRLTVTVTGGGIGLSKDGGRTWVTSRRGSLPSDCVAVEFLPGGAPGLVLGTQSGALYFSADGLDWQLAFQLPDGGHVFGLVRSGTGMLAATSHGVFSSGDGMAWSESSTGITNLTLAGLAASPVDADVLYAATDQGVFRSPDAGISWSRCSESNGVISVLVLQDGRTVLAGTSVGSVLRSVDGGDHWVAVTRGIPGVRVSILASCSTGPTTVYAGTDGGFAVSNDAGLTWESRNIDLVATAPVESSTPRTEIAALLPDTATPGTVILSLLGQGLYITRDDGIRWKRLQSSMDTPWVDSLAVDGQTGRFYAGTDTMGVYVSQDGGTTWSRSTRGLSTILSVSGAVNTIAVARDGVVYAGMQARGAATSRDEGATWQRLNSGLPDLDVRCIIVAGDGVFAMTEHCVLRLQTQ